MAKPSTTHVIEIETGIGEPAFIPLMLGQELQPISIGRKGMWRVESARVLDVHAFIYFDGAALFVQSADESAAAAVNGYRVGTSWTEVHAPCKIEMGTAQLRFRSVLAGSPHVDDQAATLMNLRSPPMAGDPRTAPRAAPRKEDPVRTDRPFKLGEFSSASPRDESTRVAPLEASGARFGADGTMVSSARQPVVDRSVEGDNVARMEGTGNAARSSGIPLQDVTLGMHPIQPSSPGGPLSRMPMQPGMMGSAPLPHSYGGGSAPYNSMGPGAAPMAGYGPTASGPAASGPSDGLFARYNELPPLKKVLVILAPFCVASAAYLLLFDQTPPEEAATLDAGTIGTVAANVTASAPPSVGPAPACPPGFVPYSVPINGQIPCVPSGTPMPANPEASTPALPTTSASIPAPGRTPPPAPISGQTLERRAVDYVAVGDYAAAAQVYEQLRQQNPTNRVYAEAARILRAKSDAGSP